MLRRTPNSSPAGSQSPLTRAQLKAAIDAEEQRQGLTSDSLIAESTLEEEAKRLGIPPEKLREAALQASAAPRASSKTTASPRSAPLWTLHSRKLFTLGIVVALTLTGIEAISRLNLLPRVQQLAQSWQSNQPRRFAVAKISPIDARFKAQLAQTIGPNPNLRMVIRDSSGWYIPGQENEESFPLEGVPDGYEVYTRESGQNQLSYGVTGSALVVFQRADPIPETVPSRERDQTVHSWRFVRYGGRWYARAWITNSDLQQFLQRSPSQTYMPVKVSTSAIPSAIEIALLPASIDTRWHFIPSSTNNELTRSYYANLPEGFKVDSALVAATKNRGEFRTEIPVQQPNQAYDPKLAYFKSAGFSASSNLVEVNQIKEGTPFSVSDNMLYLLARPLEAPPDSKLVHQIDLRPEIASAWNVVRYGDRLYVRGWIAGPVRKEALNGNSLLVSSSPKNPQMGYQPTPITLPLTNLKGADVNRIEWSAATFMRVTLDKHAWEKW